MKIWDRDRVRNSIERFKKESFNDLDINDIAKEIEGFFTIINITAANIGGRFVFRTRKIRKDDPHLLKSKVWAPATKYVNKIGRMNDVGESIFYAAFDPFTAILEGRINENEEFSLAVFTLIAMEDCNLKSVVISEARSTDTSNIDIEESAKLLNQFFIEEITKDVLEGNEFEYKKSCAMAKVMLKLPNKDSIIYPSMKYKDLTNIAMIEVEARKRMKLKVVFKCRLIKIHEHHASIEIIGEAQSIEEIDELEYRIIEKETIITPDSMVDSKINFSVDFHHSRIAPRGQF